MKIAKSILGIFFLMFLIVHSPTIAQENNDAEIKSTLSTLLELSKSKSYSDAAKHIAYKGEDSKRNLLVPLNPNDKNELAQVRRIVNKISSLLQLSSKYEIGRIIKSDDDENVNYNIEVFFTSGEQKLTTLFKVVKTDFGFLLYDMD